MSAFLAIFFLVEMAADADEMPRQITMGYDLNVKESIFNSNGKIYRKIEYRGDTFYLRMLASEKDSSSLEVECNSGSGDLQMDNQILISSSITKRSSLFIDGLKQVCSEAKIGRKKVELDPSFRIGFLLNSSEKDLIKNKKVYVTPLKPGVGLSGEW